MAEMRYYLGIFNAILIPYTLFTIFIIVSCGSESDGVSSNSYDPSTTPIEGERYRMLADFNCDGLQDMALSDEISTYGTGGIGFTIYLRNSSGIYKKYDRIGTPLGIISIECNWQNPRIWSYWHLSAASGIISYCEVTDSGLYNCGGMEIYPGDGGTVIGNSIMDAVFDNSDSEIKIQRSKTTDGAVEWVDY